MDDLNIFNFRRMRVNRKGAVVIVYMDSYEQDRRILRRESFTSVGRARREFRRLTDITARWTWRSLYGEYHE